MESINPIDLKIPSYAQSLREKMNLGLVLTEFDYNYIVCDIVTSLGLVEAPNEITNEIDRFLLTRYFKDYNKSNILKRLQNYFNHA